MSKQRKSKNLLVYSLFFVFIVIVIALIIYFVTKKPSPTHSRSHVPTHSRSHVPTHSRSHVPMIGVKVPIFFITYQGDKFLAISLSLSGDSKIPYLLDTGSGQITTSQGILSKKGPQVTIVYQGGQVTGYLQKPVSINIGNGYAKVRPIHVMPNTAPPPSLFGLAPYGLLHGPDVTPKINAEAPPIFGILPSGKRKIRFNMKEGEITFGVNISETFSDPGIKMAGSTVGFKYPSRYIIPCTSSVSGGPSYVLIDTGTLHYYANGIQHSNGEWVGVPSLINTTVTFGGKTLTLDQPDGYMPLIGFENTLGLDKDFMIIGIKYLKDLDFAIDLDNLLIHFN